MALISQYDFQVTVFYSEIKITAFWESLKISYLSLKLVLFYLKPDLLILYWLRVCFIRIFKMKGGGKRITLRYYPELPQYRSVFLQQASISM